MAKTKPRCSLHLIEHPLVEHFLTQARDRSTPPARFRELLAQIGMLVAYEATRDLPTRDIPVETPLESIRAKTLAVSVCVVPILRAGLGMAQGIIQLLPEAQVGHIGMFRDESNLRPTRYYDKIPHSIADGTTLLCDPMLATGGSAIAAVTMLKGKGAKDVRLLCLVASPEGVKKLHDEHPDVPIYTSALDRELDDRGYILPGLGDAGDRLFGTMKT